MAALNSPEQNIPFDLSLPCPTISWAQAWRRYPEARRCGQSGGRIRPRIALTKLKAEFPLETRAWRENSSR